MNQINKSDNNIFAKAVSLAAIFSLMMLAAILLKNQEVNPTTKSIPMIVYGNDSNYVELPRNTNYENLLIIIKANVEKVHSLK